MSGAGYFDLQVNGYAGVDFNQDELSAGQLHLACQKLREDGVDGILATIITEDLPRMALRLGRLAELRQRDALVKQVIAGFHVEGPFINEQDGYRGAHPRDAVLRGDADAMRRLLEAGGGLVRLVTLAPERDPGLSVTRMLTREGVKVSAGHCDPTLEELQAAVDAGLSLFTHLGNACPMQMHRHENVIQRALSLHDRLWLCFIADGAHVPFVALGNYLRCAGVERCVVVTDAIAPAGLGPGRYTLGRWDVAIGPDLVARAPDGSHLIGSVAPMPTVERNLVENLGLSQQAVDQLIRLNPRQAIGGSEPE